MPATDELAWPAELVGCWLVRGAPSKKMRAIATNERFVPDSVHITRGTTPPVVSYARGAARASSRLGQATAAAAAAAAELAGSGPSPPADEGVVSVIMIADARSCLTAVPLLLELVDR